MQPQFPPLTAAVVVCHHRCDLVTLPHVVELISALLDCVTPARWSIERACERDDLRLLKRVAARESQSIDPFYKAFLASRGLVFAVRNDNLEIVKWLFLEYCPSMLPMKGIEEATMVNNLPMLQWFFANHTDARLWSQENR